MWNERYVKANKLPTPKEWQDLAQAPYYDHVSISAPSRSGTTHLTIETILQGEGWDKGWRTIKDIAGNLRTVTDRSFGVPEAVNSGQVGYGIVIDFFAFSAQGAGFPVKFVYPTVTTLVPANVGVDRQRAEQGRRRGLHRVPALARGPGSAARARHPPPAGPSRESTPRRRPTIPIPSRIKNLQGLLTFNAELSEGRTAAVDTLFDQLITFQLEPLKAVTKVLHEVDAALKKKDNAAGARSGQGSARPDRRHADHRSAGRVTGDQGRVHRRQGKVFAPGRTRAAVGVLRQGEATPRPKPRRE